MVFRIHRKWPYQWYQFRCQINHLLSSCYRGLRCFSWTPGFPTALTCFVTLRRNGEGSWVTAASPQLKNSDWVTGQNERITEYAKCKLLTTGLVHINGMWSKGFDVFLQPFRGPVPIAPCSPRGRRDHSPESWPCAAEQGLESLETNAPKCYRRWRHNTSEDHRRQSNYCERATECESLHCIWESFQMVWFIQFWVCFILKLPTWTLTQEYSIRTCMVQQWQQNTDYTDFPPDLPLHSDPDLRHRIQDGTSWEFHRNLGDLPFPAPHPMNKFFLGQVTNSAILASGLHSNSWDQHG